MRFCIANCWSVQSDGQSQARSRGVPGRRVVRVCMQSGASVILDPTPVQCCFIPFNFLHTKLSGVAPRPPSELSRLASNYEIPKPILAWHFAILLCGNHV